MPATRGDNVTSTTTATSTADLDRILQSFCVRGTPALHPSFRCGKPAKRNYAQLFVMTSTKLHMCFVPSTRHSLLQSRSRCNSTPSMKYQQCIWRYQRGVHWTRQQAVVKGRIRRNARSAPGA